jgi:FG-GAP repeat protein
LLPCAGAPAGRRRSGLRRARSAAAPARAALVDFNGDGFDDLAVGAVNVLYGSGAGLTGANQTITQANAEVGDRFGTALAKGDFDGDGITDLAVGASGEGVSGAGNAGVVSVFYGTEDGLPGSSQSLFQGNPEELDLFGAAVAPAASTPTASTTWPSAPPGRPSAAQGSPGR